MLLVLLYLDRHTGESLRLTPLFRSEAIPFLWCSAYFHVYLGEAWPRLGKLAQALLASSHRSCPFFRAKSSFTCGLAILFSVLFDCF